jgi:hypothetical protein
VTTTTAVPTTTMPPPDRCDGLAPSACDDGDPCTVDDCRPERGCVSTPVSGGASLTCWCERERPAACAAESFPPSVARREERACNLFRQAAGTTRGTQRARRVRRGLATLGSSLTLVEKARKRGTLSNGCAGVLQAGMRDAKARAERVLATFSSGMGTGRVE